MEHRADTVPICNAVIELGWSCIPVFYSDSARALILQLAKGVDGYISRVNPDTYEDFTLSKFEGASQQACPHARPQTGPWLKCAATVPRTQGCSRSFMAQASLRWRTRP